MVYILGGKETIIHGTQGICNIIGEGKVKPARDMWVRKGVNGIKSSAM